MASGVQRKLTTILAADAEGYSRAMDADEVRTLGDLRAARGVFDRRIADHDGRIVNTAGDGLLAEFPSVVEAVQCAIEVQSELAQRADAEHGLRFRIGLHLGDVMVDNGDLFGEGVNLAARLQTMAQPGDILVSRQVYDQVRGKLAAPLNYLGQKRPRNFAEDVAVYRVGFAPTSADHAMRDEEATSPADPPAPPGPPDIDFEAVPFDPPAASTAPEPAAPQRRGLAERIGRRARLLGGIAAGLVAIDLATGGPFWAHWPGLGLATALALDSVPRFVEGRLNRLSARGAVIVAALALVNLFSWSGVLWVIWPAGAFLIIELLRRLWSPAR